MKLDCILTACNNNPLYIDFIPLFIKTWEKLYSNIDIKIILVHNIIPNEFKIYEKYIILFKPIDNLSTAFISQYIRILYPALLNYKNGILITDIDMIPMNSSYFTYYIRNITDDKFVTMRNVLINNHEIAICYNIAINKIWANIFNIKSINDIIKNLINVNNNINYIDNLKHNKAWSIDQINLYKYVMNWDKKTNNLIILNDINTKFKRLDRYTFINISDIKKNIINNIYTDYHCYRPYKKYKILNDQIYDLLK